MSERNVKDLTVSALTVKYINIPPRSHKIHNGDETVIREAGEEQGERKERV